MSLSIQRAIAIGVTMDSSEVGREVRKLNRLMGEAKSATAPFVDQQKLLNAVLSQGKLTTEQHTMAMNKLLLARHKQAEQIRAEAQAVRELTAEGKKEAAEFERLHKLEQDGIRLKRKHTDLLDRMKERYRDLNTQIEWAFIGEKEFNAELDEMMDELAEADPKLQAHKKRMEEIAAAAERAARAEQQFKQKINERAAAQWVATHEKAMATDMKYNPQRFMQESMRDLDEQFTTGQMSRQAYNLEKLRLMDEAEAMDPVRQARAQGESYMQQFNTPKEEMNRRLEEAKKLRMEGKITEKEYARAVREIRYQSSIAAAAMNQLKFGAMAVVGPISILTGAFMVLSRAIKANAEIDRLNASFKVFTGSAVQAKAVLEEIRQLSSSTPVNFTSAAEVVQNMMQSGMGQDTALKQMKNIAQITGGDPERMKMMGIAFSQSMNMGRLMAQEKNQMVNAGFNPLVVIAERQSKSLKQVVKDMEAGAVSAEMLADAFEYAATSADYFGGLLEEQANSSYGKMTKFWSTWEMMLISIGDVLEDDTNKMYSFFTYAMQGVSMLGEAYKKYYGGDVRGSVPTSMQDLGWKMGGTLGNWLMGREVQQAEEAAAEGGVGKKGDRKSMQEPEEDPNVKRVREAFDKTLAKRKEELMMQQRTADEVERINLLREQSVEKERVMIDNLIAQGAAYEKIYNAANKVAQAKAQELEVIQHTIARNEERARREKEIHDEWRKWWAEEEAREEEEKRKLEEHKQNFDQAFKDQAEAIKDQQDPSRGLARRFAEIDFMQANGFLDARQSRAERERVLSEAASQRSFQATAAPAATKGSQEAYQLIAQMSVDKINREVEEQVKTNVFLDAIQKLGAERNKLLQERNNPIKRIGA